MFDDPVVLYSLLWSVLLFVGLSYTQDNVERLPWKSAKVDDARGQGQEETSGK